MRRNIKFVKTLILKLEIMVSSKGFPPTGNIGFGHVSVKGRKRVPNPPAIINTGFSFLFCELSHLT